MWCGALVGGLLSPVTALLALGVSVGATALWSRSEATLLVLLAVGALSGTIAEERVGSTLSAPLPQGVGTMSGVAVGDATPYGTRSRVVVRPTAWSPVAGRSTGWQGPRIAVIFDGPDVAAGDTVLASGLLRASPGLVRGDPVAGRLSASTLEVVGPDRSPLMMAGNLLRARVKNRLAALGDSPRSALLAGFLIGDVAGLPREDLDALRRSGLTHFVAVSGSNVALVLGAWWLVLGPLGANNRVRAASGMVVLLVFVVATRWEASVIRAATMAALVLGGRLAGVPLDAWSALGEQSPFLSQCLETLPMTSVSSYRCSPRPG